MTVTIPDLSAFARVPEQLVTLPRWVLWRRETPEGRDKPTKVPYQPNGYRASSTAPRTWSRYETALDAYTAGGWSGIGFMLGDGWAGVDLDHCIVGGKLETWALEIICALDSYTEISPSGTGVKIVMRGTLPPKHRRIGNIEMYDRGRFFTVTGRDLWRCAA